jgi:hypothetical protein
MNEQQENPQAGGAKASRTIDACVINSWIICATTWAFCPR